MGKLPRLKENMNSVSSQAFPRRATLQVIGGWLQTLVYAPVCASLSVAPFPYSPFQGSPSVAFSTDIPFSAESFCH